MIDGENFFDQLVKNDIRAYDSIQKSSTGQGEDYTTGCLLDYNYLQEHYKMISLDLNKKNLILIQNQYNKLILEIQKINQQYFSLLKKLKERFQIFRKEL